MGNNSSSAGQDSEATAGPGAAVVDTQQVGYRILGVQPNSPTSYCSLVAHFDFIVAANSVPLKTLDTTFIELIRVSILYSHHWLPFIAVTSFYSFITGI